MRKGSLNFFLIVTLTLLLGSLFVAGFLYSNPASPNEDISKTPGISFEIEINEPQPPNGVGLSALSDSYASASASNVVVGQSVTVTGHFNNLGPGIGSITFTLKKDSSTSLCTKTIAVDSSGSCSVSESYSSAQSHTYSVYVGNQPYGSTATVTWNANNPPVAVNDGSTSSRITVSEDGTRTIDVKANDNDPDGNSITVVSVTNPANGEARIDQDNNVAYSPDPNYNGNDQFSYTIRDSWGATDSATVYLKVNPVNDNPNAVNDGSSSNGIDVTEDTPKTISVLTNDNDIDGDSISISSVGSASSGSVSHDGSQVTYIPNTNFVGSDSFTYTISDGKGGSDTATVYVDVINVNDGPSAEDDTATTDEDNSVTINVLSNDADIDGDTLSISSVGTPSNGNAVISGTSIIYTPDADYTGPDSFTYTISDGNGGSSTATVSVTVNPVNDNPVAVSDSVVTNEDTSVNIDVINNDYDIDQDLLSVLSTTDPSNGIVFVEADGTITYTPNANFNGTDSFTYTITDGTLTSTATVTVTISAVNDAPSASDNSYSVDEDTTLNGDVSLNDADIDGDVLTYSIVSDASFGTLQLNSDGTFSYLGNTNYVGDDSFTYMVTDSGGLSDTATVTITINAVNDAPNAFGDTSSTDEDTSVTISVLANDVDVDGDSLSVVGIVSSPSNGNTVLNADNTITYTPSTNYVGSDSFIYRITDGNGEYSEAQVDITIGAVNDAPVTNDQSYSTNEDTTLSGDVSTSTTDVDSASLTYTTIVDPISGSLTFNTDGSFSYVPATNFVGEVFFTFEVSDGSLTDTGTVTITVNAVNDAPVALDDSYQTNEDEDLSGDVSTNDNDIDSASLTYSLVTDVSFGNLQFNSDGTFSYTPGSNFNGQDSFSYQVSDGVLSDTASVTIDVVAVNDAPVAQDDSATSNEDTSVTLAVLDNDSDIDGDTLSVTLISVTPSSGQVIINADNTLTYTPDADFNGVDSFEYTIEDTAGSISTATVTITINAVNDAPVASNDSFSGTEDSSLSGDVSGNDGDVDSVSLSYSLVTNVASGSLTFNVDGTFTLVPTANFNGELSFTYSVTDGSLSSTATVTISIDAVNDAPVASDDSYSTSEDTTVNGDVSGNDNDVDSSSLTYSVVSGVSNGSLILNEDGSFSYTPDANFNGQDSFTYQVSDGQYSDQATVTIDVSGQNDAPVAYDDSYSVAEEGSLYANVLVNDYDVDSETLTVSLVEDVASGDLILNADGSFSYFPILDFVGEVSFTYSVSDGSLSDIATVTITVTNLNDIPVALSDSFVGFEDEILQGDVSTNDFDVDGDTLSYNLVSDVSSGSLQLNSDGTFSYTPEADFYGSVSFEYEVSDGNGAADSTTVYLTISSVNDAPVPTDDEYVTDEDIVLTGNVLDNDTDIDSTLTATLVTDVQYGSLVLNSDGSFEYTPDADWSGVDSFVYNADDGEDMVPATVTITVLALNDAPNGVTDDFTGDEETTITGNVLDNDSDPEGDSLTVEIVQDVTTGSLVLNSDGSFEYTPEVDFFGTVSFKYSVSDGLLSDTVSVVIEIVNINDIPVATGENYTGQKGQNLIVNASNGLLINDVDVDGDSLTVMLQSSTNNGALTLAADGSFTYIPNAGFVGVDVFSYYVTDGVAESNVVSVTISIEDTQDTTEETDSSLPIDTGDVDVPVNTLFVIISILSLGVVARMVNRKESQFQRN